MRLAISSKHQRVLARGVAIFLVGGVAAGCSSDVTRFQDSILTGSSRPQQAAPVTQAYPGDYANLDQTTTASIAPSRRGGILGRAGLTPRPQGSVGGGVAMAAAPVTNTYPANPYPVVQQQVQAAPAWSPAVTTGPALAPVATRASLDTTVTGSTAPAPRQVAAAIPAPVVEAVRPLQPAPQPRQPAPAPVVAAGNGGGWSRAGGTQVSVREGETVYNLSRRFGVPADAILKANGMASPNALAAGQQVVIPTYVHSAQAPISAPDANPNVADARSSTGTRYDVRGNQIPVPGQAPADRLAVVPQQPKVKEQDTATPIATADPKRTTAPASGGYTVVSGDTLNAIARRNGTTTAALKQANGLNDGVIRIGQKLVIPAAGAPVAQVAAIPAADRTTTGSVSPSAPASGASTAGYAPPQKQTDKVIQQAALDTSAAPDATGIARMRWPARGRVISGFGGSGGGKKNDGIDIAVPAGTSIKAAENGVVIYAGDGLKEFGNTVLVRHEDGLVTVYGHAGAINVQRGQKVRRGEEIATSGMSGSAETPKLHFEVRKNSTPVNPVTYLE